MLTALLALLLNSAAAAPSTLTWSGRLLDAQGQPIHGTETLTVRLWGDATTDDLRWSDTLSATVHDGYVNLTLGDEDDPVDAEVLAGGQVHVQVIIGTTELALQPLNPV